MDSEEERKVLTKTCTKCRALKSLDGFGFRKSKSGYKSWCKKCESDDALRYVAEHPEHVARRAQNDKARYDANSITQIAYARQWNLAHPDRVALHARKSKMKSKYGITIEQYEEMVMLQNGCCANLKCLHRPDPTAKNKRDRVLHIDHIHVDGFADLPPEEKRKYIRGLLCRPCNLAVGLMKDCPARLVGAVAYLELPRDR